VRPLAAVAVIGFVGCVHFGRPAPGIYAGTHASSLVVLNFSRSPVHFEFRVDGVQVVDTTVSVGGLPPVVLGRVVRLTRGKHRLELYDTRNGEYKTQIFEVRDSDMTIEIRFSNEHAELRTYYARVVYE
jgi:hypothetical protein